MRALAIAAVLLLAVAVTVAHIFDLSERAFAVRTFTGSKTQDLRLVGRYEPGEAAICDWQGRGDEEPLVRALVTVESLATSRIEAWWKTALVRVAALLGLPIPDLTYGPGRLRLSTAAAAVRADDRTGGDGTPTDAEVATRLLDYCEAKPIVAAVVADILASRAPAGRSDPVRLDLADVRTVARIYNGQARPLTPEAAVAHATYNALVYALFQRYRFDALAN
jgi:hypothetical protein